MGHPMKTITGKLRIINQMKGNQYRININGFEIRTIQNSVYPGQMSDLENVEVIAKIQGLFPVLLSLELA